jgi:hypothetical protein
MSLDGAATAKTSNGVSWDFIVGWDDAGGTSANLDIGLERTVTSGGTGEEGHLWSVPVTTATLAFDAKTGAGTLDAGTQTSPIAKVDLAFKATSNKKGTCTTGSETIYSGALSGEASLVTGLTGGGTVGGTSVKFTVITPTITVDSGCSVVTDSCVASATFISTLSPGKSPFAVNDNESLAGKAGNFVEVGRSTDLKAPAHSSRIDVAAVDSAPATYDSTTKVLSVTTSTAGLVTGSATLSGGTAKTEPPQSCTFAGKKYTVSVIEDSTAKYASPAGKSISAKTSLTGTLTAPNTSDGLYEVVTVKAA